MSSYAGHCLLGRRVAWQKGTLRRNLALQSSGQRDVSGKYLDSCLKHRRSGTLTEEGSCVFNVISGMAVSVPIVCCIQDLVALKDDKTIYVTIWG
jgi:hypothetical protein